MDHQLKRRVTNDYPYPVTIDFMRLNTPDYRDPDLKRLSKIIDVVENTIHFLALISLNDLLENRMKKEFAIPDQFKQRFRNNFTRTSMGKWGELLRETIKIFISHNIPMFIEETAGFFVEDKTGESEAQKAFNQITSIRNKLQHKEEHYSRLETEQLCLKAEELLEFLLEKLDFITAYQFLYVNKITVDYHRWSHPHYKIDLSNIIGSNPELFDAQTEKSASLINTPAIIVTKKDRNLYLNLEPLVIYSDEGNMGIPDIFMYMDWEKNTSIKYKPIWKGGTFNLYESKESKIHSGELLRFFEYFALEEDFLSFKSSVEKEMEV
ncbi:MAG: hypothetical protein NTU44_16470 [Bacteroidetes bacterium]|nr:hypothetical protein [Bacteroidota bacterium]